MRYWWVNHKQTFTEETTGNFLWAPKTQKGGKRSHFYDNMTRVSPGDIVFSYANTQICGFGRAMSKAKSEGRPDIFEKTGDQWEEDGWRLDVVFQIFDAKKRFKPKNNIVEIMSHSFLPSKYSPLNHQGDGNQGAYLSEISQDFGNYILEKLSLAGNRRLVQEFMGAELSLDMLEAREEIEIIRDSQLTETERLNLVTSRVGQGIFRKKVLQICPACVLTSIENPDLLVASHIKPWRLCDNRERLDPENGLMLTPNADCLFDSGLISFADDGELLIAKTLALDDLKQLGILNRKVAPFGHKKAMFLAFHRKMYGFSQEIV